ncbi:LpqN/LpqT family lipoprotein [Mycolicibacterium thermoresistibile]
MRVARCAVALALLAGTVAGCGDDIPDYQSVWTTTTTSPTQTSDAPVPIHQYLESVGVVGTPVAPDKVPDFTITMPSPPGWQPYQNPNYAPGTRVIAKGDTYPIAMLMVFELAGDFDVARAIEHGYADAELSQNFKRLNASNENWHGYPSSMIEGSYDLNGRRMQSYNRIVIPTGSPPAEQRYLIQLTVTSFAEDAATHGADIETIIRDFTVTPK